MEFSSNMADQIREGQANLENPASVVAEEIKAPPPARRDSRNFRGQQQSDSGLIEKVIQINRVAKVVKGGKRFHFSALVMIGNAKGEIGYALGKANEVADAIRKGLVQAKKNLIRIPMKGTTIPHDVIGHYGAAKVILRHGVPGTGIIAGGAVRALCECAGIKDILAKSLGSDNAINVLKAALDGFSKLIVRSNSYPVSDEKISTDEKASS